MPARLSSLLRRSGYRTAQATILLLVMAFFAPLSHADWDNYQVNVRLESTDNDSIGVMFRYVDNRNYYRFDWNQQTPGRTLKKVQNGTVITLASDDVAYQTNRSYEVIIRADGSNLSVEVDGEPVFQAADTTFGSGGVALYCSGNATSHYDDLRLMNLRDGEVLLSFDFTSTSVLQEFIVVNEGDAGGSPNWSINSGRLSQTSNTYKSGDWPWARGTYALLRQSTMGNPSHNLVSLESRLPETEVGADAVVHQSNPRAATDDKGNYAIAWEEAPLSGGDVYFAVFDGEGVPFSEPVQVNDSTGDHRLPDVALDEQGRVWVVWQEDTDGNGHYNVSAKAFDFYGGVQISQFMVNQTYTGQQYRPEVEYGEGNVVFTWEDDKDNDNKKDIYIRVFDTVGEEVLSELRVNSNTTGQHRNSAFSVTDTNTVAIVWEDDSDSNGYYQIHAAIIDLIGGGVLREFTVNSVASGQQLKPSVVAGPAGSFSVAYEDDKNEDGQYEVLMRGFNANGSERFSDRPLNFAAPTDNRNVSLTALSSGRILAVWEQRVVGQAESDRGFVSRVFNADGSALVNNELSWKSDTGAREPLLRLAPATNDTVVSTWSADSEGDGLREVMTRIDLLYENPDVDYIPPPAPLLNSYPDVTSINTYTFSGSKEAGSALLRDRQVIVGANSSTTWSYETALAFGDNTFSFTARDAAGNVSAPAVANIRYDDQAPGPVAITVDPEGSGTELALSWPTYNEVENGNDVACYEVYLATHSYTSVEQANLVAQVPAGTKAAELTELQRDTAYYVSVVAVDTQGLSTPTVAPVQVTPVDVQAPDEIASLQVQPSATSIELSWKPSANTDGDLASYTITYADDGELKTAILPAADVADANPVTFTLSDLSSASAHNVTVSAVDQSENASAGLNDPAVTLLSNPANLQAEVLSGRADLSWSPSQPHDLVKHYAVYVQENNFTSVEGLSPRLITAKGSASQSVIEQAVAGLTNDVTVYVAVTAVNLSNGESENISTIAVTPEEDTEGPAVESVLFIDGTDSAQQLDFAAAPLLEHSGAIAVRAADEAGVSHVQLTLDGQLLANLLSPAADGSYQHALDLVNLADGSHTLAVQAYDLLDNKTETTYSFTVSLAAPGAPVISKPAATLQTNEQTLIISGSSSVGTQVRVLNNGVGALAAVPVNSVGEFSGILTLTEGENRITAQAQYVDRSGWSADSAARVVTLNTQIPDTPTGLSATPAEQGEVHLGWNAVTSSAANNKVAGYNLYRSSAAFTSTLDAGVEKVNNTLISGTSYTNLVLTDGQYFYAITAVNEAENESALSGTVEVTVDSAGPVATRVIYSPTGTFDEASGRTAPGLVDVSVVFDEPLRNKPYFALVPEGGIPIAVDLTKSYTDDTRYSGQFEITPATPSGTAYVVMSAYDNAGNRGTEVQEGANLLIDSDGPEVTELAINPTDPLRVDEVAGLSVDVSLLLNDEVVAGESPRLVPLLDQQPVAGYEEGIQLYRDNLSEEGTPLWLGSFTLPNTAGLDENGEPSVANLSFSYAARDDLGNESTRINGKAAFQVYQGDLPPLAVPFNLTAKPLAGGAVALGWRPVEEAVAYILYRQGPNDTELVAMEPVTGTTFTDTTDVDGTYLYAVASVRQENQQEATSAASETVSVSTDRVQPGAPLNLTLELNGAGIVAKWQHPTVDGQGNPQIPQGLTYNLYRTALAEGEQVTDTQGLTPIQTDIPEPIALDTEPDENEHSYFVTAVDEAGNESAPSETVYLNFGLLPVTHLNVKLAENGFPQITWKHAGDAISHYRVYRGAGEGVEPVLLTPEPIEHTSSTTTFVDETYNGGQVSDGAHQQATYTVVAVDAFDTESVGRTITLPAVSVSLLNADVTLKRGVMNKVMFRVDNKGTDALNGLRLFATVTVQGETRQHQSDYFSIAAGSFAQVPVVIGGYAELDGIEDVQLRVEQVPQPGDKVTIGQMESLIVTDSALRVSLAAESFTRGGTGTATFTLENPSDVETEILMAVNSGNKPSPEVRLVLEDNEGNVLSVKPVQQYTGGVISVANGQTVARLAPGASFTSQAIEVPVPSAAPDQVKLRLVIDKFHYHSGRETHVAIEGTGTRTDLTLSETPYYAEVNSVSPAVVYGAEQPVTIEGVVIDRATGRPLANVPVKLVLDVRGFEQSFTVYSDASGAFSYDYTSTSTSGTYRVSALHPDVLERPNHGEFRIEGASISPHELTVRVPRNYMQEIPIRINAGHESILTNVRLVQVPGYGQTVPQLPQGVTATYSALEQVNAKSTGYLKLNFNGDNTAEATGELRFRVEADNFTGENALGEVLLAYTLSEAKPAIVASPAYVDTGVGLEQQTVEQVTLTNKGLETLINARVELTKPDGSAIPEWVTMNTVGQLGDVSVGAARQVQLTIAPGAEVSEGNYEFKLSVTGDNFSGYSVPVFVAVTQSGIGNAFFHVSDIYTATLDENMQLIPGLQGARIRLQNEQVLTETFDLTTDAYGEATFEGIPAGRYAYRASAFDHGSVSGRIWIKPGVTTAEEVFLVNSLVNVEWSVREITIEDRYEIKLEATYETKVPVAVVMFDPLSIQLPVMKKGDVFQGELTLTNHGLIRANNVENTLPQGGDMVRFEFLREVPLSLEAGQVFVLPYRIQALRDFDPEADANATGGGCGSFNAQTRVSYDSQCANGTTVPGGTSANWNSNWGSCGGSGGADHTVYYWHGGPAGSGGSSYYPTGVSITGEPPLWCRVETECEDCNPNNGSAK